MSCLRSHRGKQCQPLNPDGLCLKPLGLSHYTRVWSKVKAIWHKPKKSEPWTWAQTGSEAGDLLGAVHGLFLTSLLPPPGFKGTLWRAAASLWSGSVENTEGKEGEVLLRRWLWWDCRWSRYFLQKVSFKSCYEFLLFLLSSWPYPSGPALSELMVNQLTSVYCAPAMHQTLCSGYSRAMSCWEFKEIANQYADF